MKKIFVYGDPAVLVNYNRAVNDSGAECVISENVADAKRCDALLLAGGGDVSPCLYKTARTNCKAVSLKRDISELYLIALFLHRKAPIMGVCRGLQILNVFFDGTLNQSILHEEIHYAKNKDVTHKITDSKKGFMRELFGENLIVNSAHRQSVNKLGKGLIICAKSNDNVIEAFEHKDEKVIAVQFHPERMGEINARVRTFIYDYFISMI